MSEAAPMSNENRQVEIIGTQPKPNGRGARVTEQVIEDLRERDRLGREKYGESLRCFNGRKALQDAYEEALDLAQYMKQAIMEDEKRSAYVSKLEELITNRHGADYLQRLKERYEVA